MFKLISLLLVFSSLLLVSGCKTNTAVANDQKYHGYWQQVDQVLHRFENNEVVCYKAHEVVGGGLSCRFKW